MLVLDGKRIIRMTSEGIAYLDEETFEHFIYFEDCYQNELKERENSWERHNELNPSDDSSFEDYMQRGRSFKQVAARDVNDLFIEFYTKPRICFKFDNKDDWWKLRKHIEKAGWRTRDMA